MSCQQVIHCTSEYQHDAMGWLVCRKGVRVSLFWIRNRHGYLSLQIAVNGRCQDKRNRRKNKFRTEFKIGFSRKARAAFSPYDLKYRHIPEVESHRSAPHRVMKARKTCSLLLSRRIQGIGIKTSLNRPSGLLCSPFLWTKNIFRKNPKIV